METELICMGCDDDGNLVWVEPDPEPESIFMGYIDGEEVWT